MWKSPLSAKFLGHFSPLIPLSAAAFASVASDDGGLLWRKLERSKSLVLLQVGGLTCRWLRMLNDSWAGRNPTKGCSADWRRRRRLVFVLVLNIITQLPEIKIELFAPLYVRRHTACVCLPHFSQLPRKSHSFYLKIYLLGHVNFDCVWKSYLKLVFISRRIQRDNIMNVCRVFR
jgi:hypothetical protein